jgi:hypothetical protein
MAKFCIGHLCNACFFRNEEGAEKVAQLLHDDANEKYELYMACINAGEVFYISY